MMRLDHHRTMVLMTFHGELYRGVVLQQRLGSCVRSDFAVSPADHQYVTLIDTSLSCLEDDYKRIVRNDFLDPKPKNWWMEYYAKSTYYRLRQRALEHFLRCLHGQ
jgi:hypothetical protein